MQTLNKNAQVLLHSETQGSTSYQADIEALLLLNRLPSSYQEW